MHQKRQYKKWQNTTKILMGVLSLMCGCAIYLLFRSKALYIYIWCKAIGCSPFIDSLRISVQNWPVSDFFRFSMPDGLYCAAYILIMDAIWSNENCWQKYLFIAVVPVITMSSEVLQYYGLVKGTFDIVDLFCYFVPSILYIYINQKTIIWHNNIKNIEYEK